MYDICCIGHITLDRIITPAEQRYMPGGTAFYFSHAVRQLPVHYALVTAVAAEQMNYVAELREDGTDVTVFASASTVYFENIYGHNSDERQQRVLATADAFSADQLKDINASYFHLGPLLANDIPLDLISSLSERAIVSLDVQGYLRTVKDTTVLAVDWKQKLEALKYVHILKVNEWEMEVLTGTSDIRNAAIMLNSWGVQEVVITLGSKGSVVFHEDLFMEIPACKPARIVDATGCGDTYMAGYLYKRAIGAGVKEAAIFASAMASCKIENAGPFKGDESVVLQKLNAG